MVHILSNGEIVPDDDPRLNRQTDTRERRSQGSIRHDEDDQQENAQGGGQGGVSIFQMLNQRLLDAGLPSWNAGPYVVQPIVSVGLLLALMLFGYRGLFFGGMLFLVTKWSMAGDGPRTFMNNIGLGGLFGGGGGQRGAQRSGVRTQRGDGETRGRRTGSGNWSSSGGSGHRLGNL